MKKFISLSLVMFIIWIAMAGIDLQEIILGAVVSLVLSFLVSSYVNISFSLKTIPGIVLFVLLYIPLLFVELIKANLDVAKRVLNPKLPINPRIVKVPTKVKSDVGKLILANSITLTPGTISIDADEDHIYVHCIDKKGVSKEEEAKAISSNFEKVLGRIFND